MKNTLKKSSGIVLALGALAASGSALAVDENTSYFSLGMVLTQSLLSDETVMLSGTESQPVSGVSDPKGFNVKYRSTDRGNDWGIVYSVTAAEDEKTLNVDTDQETEQSIRYLTFAVGPSYTFEKASVYSLVGISQLKVEESKEDSPTLEETDYGLNLGFGASYAFNRHFMVDAHIEVPDVSLDSKDTNKAALSLGFGVRF